MDVLIDSQFDVAYSQPVDMKCQIGACTVEITWAGPGPVGHISKAYFFAENKE